ncbi:MAG: hypothetical protein ABEJ23_00960 [Haloarculaceae archaeon]
MVGRLRGRGYRTDGSAGLDRGDLDAARAAARERELAEDGSVPVRKYTDEEGNVTGSEWIDSDDDGRRERRDTSNLTMQAPHHSPQGKDLKDPEY